MGVGRRRVILVLNLRALALGFVINILYTGTGCRHGVRVEQAGRLPVLLQPYVDAFQKISLVVPRANDVDRNRDGRSGTIAVWSDDLDGAVEGVVVRATVESFNLTDGLWIHSPIRRIPGISDELSCAMKQVALEIVFVVGYDACTVEELINSTAMVVGDALALAIHRALCQPLISRPVAHQHFSGAPQRIVAYLPHKTPAVPGANGLARHVVEHPAFARFHAGLVDAIAEHVVVVAHDDAAKFVSDLVALRVAGTLVGIAYGALVAFDVKLDAG